MRRAVADDSGDVLMLSERLLSRLRRSWPGRVCALWRNRGAAYLLHRLQLRLLGSSSYYPKWIRAYDTISAKDVARIKQRISQFEQAPKISIIMTGAGAALRDWQAAIRSVCGQIYSNWELVVAQTCLTSEVISSCSDDSRIRLIPVSAEDDLKARAELLHAAAGDFVVFFDASGLLRPHALYMVAEEAESHPDASLIYSDEDRIDRKGKRLDPNFKTDWNPDLFLSQNYLGHCTAYRRHLISEVGGLCPDHAEAAEYDLALRIVERISPDGIRHVPFILHHWRVDEGAYSANHAAAKAALNRKVVRDHLKRTGVSGTVEPTWSGRYQRVRRELPEVTPSVSLIIPTRDRVELLRGSVGSILERTDYPNFEIVIVDNQSENSETLAYLEKISEDRRIRVIRYDLPFNYSAINNYAARHCTSEILGLINNDVEVINRDWLRELVSHAMRPEVGAAGAMLYYPGEVIQHAGIIVGIGGAAINCYGKLPRGASGYRSRAELIQNFSAVTGACLLTRAEIFSAVGGLNEADLPVAFNDVDYCLRLREQGYQIVWTPYAELYHLESVSRGDDFEPQNIDRHKRERDYFAQRWAAIIRNDPFHNPNFSLDGLPFEQVGPPRCERPWLRH